MLNRLVSSQSSSSNHRNRDRNRNRQDRNNSQGYVPPVVTFSYSDAPYLPHLRLPPPARPLPIPRFETNTRTNQRGNRAINTGYSGQVRGQRNPRPTSVHPLPHRPVSPPPVWARTRNYAIPIVRPPPDYSPPRPAPPPYLNDEDGNSTMSRASARPTHIPMPTANGVNANGSRSPNGSPLPTPQGATSPTSPRNSFLPSFIRTRSRAATLTGGRGGRSSPTVEASNPLGGSRPAVSRTPSHTGESTHVTRSVSTPHGMQATNANTSTTDPNPKPPAVSPQVKARINAAQPPRDTPITTYRIRLVPHLESTRSLAFDPVTREMLPILCPPGITPTTVAHNLDNVPNALNGRPPALILKVGRFTEKTTTAPQTAATAPTTGAGPSTDAIGEGPMSAVLANSGGGGDICSSRVAFKSKVVSRSHAEIWCEPNGKVSPSYI